MTGIRSSFHWVVHRLTKLVDGWSGGHLFVRDSILLLGGGCAGGGGGAGVARAIFCCSFV